VGAQQGRAGVMSALDDLHALAEAAFADWWDEQARSDWWEAEAEKLAVVVDQLRSELSRTQTRLSLLNKQVNRPR